jgi:hypothetical protein
MAIWPARRRLTLNWKIKDRPALAAVPEACSTVLVHSIVTSREGAGGNARFHCPSVRSVGEIFGTPGVRPDRRRKSCAQFFCAYEHE